MAGKGFLLAVVLVGLCGCRSPGSKGLARDNVAVLSDGSVIYVFVERPGVTDSQGTWPQRGPVSVWQRPGLPDETLVTLVPSPGSPTEGPRIHEPSAEDGVHTSDDGARVWIVKNGQVVSSFDYARGTAILGRYGQPEWARIGK